MSEERGVVPSSMGRVEVAEYLGLESVRSLSRMTLPPHDVEVGVHKGWKPETIDAWNAARPGRGRWGAQREPAVEDEPVHRPSRQ